MDFSIDDEDDWDANALDALESEAVNIYAATQQRTQQQRPAHRAAPAKSNTIEEVDVNNIDEVVYEKQRLEKLARDKQGELLILKGNIAKANREHSAALEQANYSNKAIKDDLTRQLELFKDKVARLETDLTFQRQELKAAKVRAGELQKTAPSSPRHVSRFDGRSNGFPSKTAFEPDNSHGGGQRLTARKRRRTGIHVPDETALDEFDLAEVKARERSLAVLRDEDPEDTSMIIDQQLPHNGIVREDTNDMAMSVSWTSLPFGLSAAEQTDTLTVYNACLNVIGVDGITCIQTLMLTKNMLDPNQRSIGQSFIDALNTQASLKDPESLSIQLTRFAVSQLFSQTGNVSVSVCLLTLLDLYLQLFAKPLAIAMLQPIEDQPALIQRLLELAASSQTRELRSAALNLMERLSECLNRDVELCPSLVREIPMTLVRGILSTDKDGDLRMTLLRIFGNLTTRSGAFPNASELLDLVSLGLDKDDLAIRQLRPLRTTICQYLYCVILYYEDGLDLARKSRVVIPRLVRRLARELEDLYETSDPIKCMSLIRMSVKLCHILLKDETNATSDQHWRSLEIKATHLTNMTRILYAEDHDDFDNTTQDLAMDLLEMAVSPEEGNDIYEVMGGISSSDG